MRVIVSMRIQNLKGNVRCNDLFENAQSLENKTEKLCLGIVK